MSLTHLFTKALGNTSYESPGHSEIQQSVVIQKAMTICINLIVSFDT